MTNKYYHTRVCSSDSELSRNIEDVFQYDGDVYITYQYTDGLLISKVYYSDAIENTQIYTVAYVYTGGQLTKKTVNDINNLVTVVIDYTYNVSDNLTDKDIVES